MTKLRIDGNSVVVTADYSMRWVENTDGETRPVLYYQGKRITKDWQIEVVFDSPQDPHGDNANTA